MDQIEVECGKCPCRLQSSLRDEVRIVHNEVMSLDARVSLLEEQGVTGKATSEVLKRDRRGFGLEPGRQPDPRAQSDRHTPEGEGEVNLVDGYLKPRLGRRPGGFYDGHEPMEVLRQMRPMQET
eukprot:symbB.v1.2.032379.t1/scaffold3885.1/size48838/3